MEKEREKKRSYTKEKRVEVVFLCVFVFHVPFPPSFFATNFTTRFF